MPLPDDVAVDDPSDPPAEPELRLSKRRVLAAVLTVGALVTGGVLYARSPAPSAEAAGTAAGAASSTWFAPYVDTTLTPTLQFQDPAVGPARQVVLGFVVADREQPCSPSWGGYYSLAEAADQLNLDRRIAQLQSDGSTALVSFGGLTNTELAVGCTDVVQLTKAYQSVVDRYDLHTIDLDLEGAALDDHDAVVRRATVIAALQRSAVERDQPLGVWLTLPVDRNGLQANALTVVREMVDAGVQLSGVNVMTMDFSSAPDGMYAAVTGALEETHRQLTAIYRARPTQPTSAQLWAQMGATVMIGQNDVTGQILTIEDAQRVAGFAADHGLGRVSMWSLNRDIQCGTQFARIGIHSTTCSGTTQLKLGFAQVFGALTGTVPLATADPSAASAAPAAPVADDPATAPFPIWNPEASYPTAYKVVREGYVYQAKWYSSAVDPAADAADPGQSPWQIVGPVLPTDRPPVVPTLAPGTHPDWSATVAFEQGAKVLRDGLPYQAKYFTLGDDPAAVLTNPAGSPWKALYTIPGEPAPAG